MTRRPFLVLAFCLSEAVTGQSLEDRSYWIEKYYTVSYPLKDVVVTSAYGVRNDPITGMQNFHGGLDLKADHAKALSMFDGIVIVTGKDDKSGNYVSMSYGKYVVNYCHLAEILVHQGDTILAGAPIGITGASGRTNGPHLHLTSKKDGALINPLDLLLYIRDIKKRCCNALGVNSSKTDNPHDFFERYAPIAIEQQQKFGIPASVTLAQMAHESMWGKSDLARKGNNYFGIKANKSWIDEGRPYSLHDDDRKGEPFCNYKSAKESVEHHSALLMSNRYRRCRRYAETDYHNWLVSIKAAGYATADNYVQCCEIRSTGTKRW